MKKVKLTQKEEEQIKALTEIGGQIGLLYEFQSRMGGGDYTLDMEKGEVWQKTFKDR